MIDGSLGLDHGQAIGGLLKHCLGLLIGHHGNFVRGLLGNDVCSLGLLIDHGYAVRCLLENDVCGPLIGLEKGYAGRGI